MVTEAGVSGTVAVILVGGQGTRMHSERPKMVQQLNERLQVFKRRMKSGEPNSEQTEVPLDEDLLKRLRSLGYVE